MSRNTKPTAAPERQEPKNTRTTGTQDAGQMRDQKQNANTGPQFDRKDDARRDAKGEAGRSRERTPERRTAERADETGKQKVDQQNPR
ncbi:MAG: hypothetical protein R6X14_09210 [bacterium]